MTPKRIRGIAAAVFALALLEFPTVALAHSPYLVKLHTVSGPDGHLLIVAKLFGDGIFTTDPVSLEIRSTDGRLIAYTPTAEHVAVICPTMRLCWAFPYGVLSLFTVGMKLDYRTLDFDGEPDNLGLQSGSAGPLQEYLTDRQLRRFSSAALPYPEARHDYKGFDFVPVSMLLGPLVIVVDQIIPLGAVGLLSAILPLLILLFIRRWRPRERPQRILLRVFGVAVTIGYVGLFGTSLIVLGFTMGTPWLYMIATMAAGFLLPVLIGKNYWKTT